ncbi:MAG TPA: hypothetical protein VFJ08_00405 [Salinisphaera sp.]|nr:hypothetical protein [Salinisphaera sp.]HET7312797.1 hypothetical protein [Salinisphaera sp.]
MAAIISRVTSLGAAAPGSSTAPMTRSAPVTARSRLSVFEYSVVRRLP